MCEADVHADLSQVDVECSIEGVGSTNGTNGVALPDTVRIATVVDGEVGSYSLVMDAENPSTYQQSFIDNPHVPDNSRLLIKCLSSKGTLIDIGANIGTVCLPVAVSGSQVLALELLPSNVAKLTLAARVNGLEAKLRIRHVGVTHYDGTAGFTGREAWGQISDAPDAPRVAVLTLDTIIRRLREHEPDFLQLPIVMKLDVEGHEWAVLKGAEGMLHEYRPAFIFESIQPAHETAHVTEITKQFVADHGYSMFAIRGKVLFPYALGDLQVGVVYDILAVPKERSDMFSQLTPEFEFRPLTVIEEVQWLREMVSAGVSHRAHSRVMLAKLEERLGVKTPELTRIKQLLSEAASS